MGWQCNLEMLSNGASKGIAGVDRSLGERNGGQWVAQWWLVRDSGLARERKRQQQHRDFLKLLKIRENKGEDCEE